MNVIDFPQRLDAAGYEAVPQHTIEALERYVFHGLEPGSFLMAVLCNDLAGAVGRADPWNRRAIPEIVEFVYNRLPGNSWGNLAIVQRFISEHPSRKVLA